MQDARTGGSPILSRIHKSLKSFKDSSIAATRRSFRALKSRSSSQSDSDLPSTARREPPPSTLVVPPVPRLHMLSSDTGGVLGVPSATSSGLYTPCPRTPIDGSQLLRVLDAAEHQDASEFVDNAAEYYGRFYSEFAPCVSVFPEQTAAILRPRIGEFPTPARKASFDTLASAPSEPGVQHVFAGPYRIIGTLGSGSNGKVLAAEDAETDPFDPGVVAIKVIPKIQLRSMEEVREVGWELKILQFITEKAGTIGSTGPSRDERGIHFVQMLYRSFQDEMRIYFALEYHPSTLSSAEILDYLRNPPLGQEDAAHESLLITTAEVTEGLLYLHSLGVIHHDVKPPNILISASGHAIITDFGGSRIRPTISIYSQGGVEHRFGMMEVRGDEPITFTPFFAAPELIRMEEDKTVRYDERSDWWSLGVMVYALLCDELPYGGDLGGSGDSMPGWEEMVTLGELDFSGVKVDTPGKHAVLNFIRKLMVLDPNCRLTGAAVRKHPVFDPIRDRWDDIANMQYPAFPEHIIRWGCNRLDTRLTFDDVAGREHEFDPCMTDRWIEQQDIRVDWARSSGLSSVTVLPDAPAETSFASNRAIYPFRTSIAAPASIRSLPEPESGRATVLSRATSIGSPSRSVLAMSPLFDLGAFPIPPSFWIGTTSAAESLPIPFPKAPVSTASLPDSEGPCPRSMSMDEKLDMESGRNSYQFPQTTGGALSSLEMTALRASARPARPALDSGMKSMVYLASLIDPGDPEVSDTDDDLSDAELPVQSFSKAQRVVKVHPRVILKSLQGAIQKPFSGSSKANKPASELDSWVVLQTGDDILSKYDPRRPSRRPTKLRRKRSLAPSAARKNASAMRGDAGGAEHTLPAVTRTSGFSKLLSPLKRGLSVIRARLPNRR